jgi:hypothetical protein
MSLSARKETTMSVSHRFFVSHFKDITDDVLESTRVELEKQLVSIAQGKNYTLTLARDDWEENFHRCGGWDEWIDYVVNGTAFGTSEPRYTGFVSVGRVLGKASAGILRLALLRPAPVAIFEQHGGNNWTLTEASRVTPVERNNFKAGWWLD